MKNTDDTEQYFTEMKKALKPDRYRHSVGVAYTAASLAMVHGADIRKALTAGILHDCAKNISHEEQLKLLRKHNIEVTESEKGNQGLLHAKSGMYLAESKYGIVDPEILGAIRWHTTGRPEMSLLEKIVYVADFIEPHRKPLECLPAIRRTAFENIDRAVMDIAGEVTGYLDTLSAVADPMTMETYRYYKNLA